MYRAVLFDLDGTLLPVDTKQFLEDYIALLKQAVKGLYDPDEFVQHVLAGSQNMIQSDCQNKTNQDIFFEYFSKAVHLPVDQVNAFFEKFYSEFFPNLKNSVQIKSGHIEKLEKIMTHIEESGAKKVVATNPVFPREAINHRLKWIALDPYDFDLITSYEVMCSAKPKPAYYQEIADRLGLKSSECIMVGNDTREDLIAEKVGMEVFLLTEYIIDPDGFLSQHPLEKKGELHHLLKFLEKNL